MGNGGFSIKKPINTINEEKDKEELCPTNLDISLISSISGGYISANSNIFDNIPNTPISRRVLNEALHGTPLVKIGSGGQKVMVIAGIHGNEIPPQIAAVHLIHKLINLHKRDKLNGSVYVIPFSVPKSSMINSRFFNGVDLNRKSNVEGSVTNKILAKIEDLKIKSIGDFHSTAPGSMPGREGIFCTMKPSPESFHIGKYISDSIKSELLFYSEAGDAYKGAIEDESNIRRVPAVTCEVLSPNGIADKTTYHRSLEQMESYLTYFGIISDDL